MKAMRTHQQARSDHGKQTTVTTCWAPLIMVDDKDSAFTANS